MSRADAFDAFYREAHSRLLHEVYAATGTVSGALKVVGETFVAAAHHWRKVESDPQRDAWLRERALRTAHRDRVGVRGVGDPRTPEASRTLFEALRPLSHTERHLLVAHLLAGLELATAAREAGLTDDDAARALERSERAVRDGGIDLSERSLADRLADLRADLRDVPPDRPRRLRREGNRRRRAHLVLAGAAVTAVAIGAGALTAAKPEASGVIEALPGTTPPSTPTESVPPTFEQPDFTAAQLTHPDVVERLDPDARWRTVDTSPDFGPTMPVHPCLSAIPSDPKADHLWLREFASGRKQPTRVIQVLEVSESAERAGKSYERLVQALGTCPRGGYEVSGFTRVSPIGDQATLVRLDRADRSRIRTDQLAVARSGNAVVVWLVQAADGSPVKNKRLSAVLAESVNAICGYADGECSGRPVSTTEVTPPPASRSRGFLSAADLPVLVGLPDPWVATDPARTRKNPAATDCDRADFAEAGASLLRTRDYVVPTAERLGDIFGMTQTIGEFRDQGDARAFVRQVTGDVAGCNDRQLSLEVPTSDELDLDRGTAIVWTIKVGTSEQRALTFRVALVRVGTSVSQLTFTPTEKYDVAPKRYAALVERMVERIAQA